MSGAVGGEAPRASRRVAARRGAAFGICASHLWPRHKPRMGRAARLA